MPIRRTIHDLLDEIGEYEVTEEGRNLDCVDGDLEQAYARGWNAALLEAKHAAMSLYPRKTVEDERHG